MKSSVHSARSHALERSSEFLHVEGDVECRRGSERTQKINILKIKITIVRNIFNGSRVGNFIAKRRKITEESDVLTMNVSAFTEAVQVVCSFST